MARLANCLDMDLHNSLAVPRLFLTCICLAEIVILVPNLLTEIAIERGSVRSSALLWGGP